MLTQQVGPPVPKQGEMSELVPRIRLGNRIARVSALVAREHQRGIRSRELVRIQPQFFGEGPVQQHQPGSAHRDRVHPRKKRSGQTSITVVEIPAHGRDYFITRTLGPFLAAFSGDFRTTIQAEPSPLNGVGPA